MAQIDLSVDPKAEYERKLVSPEQAVGLVESGDTIWIPSSHLPPTLLAVLATREEELSDVTLRSIVIPNMGWFREDAAETWNLQVQHAIAPDNRQALAERLIDFMPFSMINQHKAWDTGRPDARSIDDLMICVSPPNERGFLCVGNAVWDAVSTAKRAKRVIAEQSDAMPITCGDSWLHISQIDAIVQGDRPRLGVPDPDPAGYPEQDRRIAAHLKSLVRDGDTLQLGIGKHTGAATMLGAFDDANDLGYFGELTVPGTVALARKGVITGRRAEVVPDRFVACHIGNSLEDLEHIENNPFFEHRSYEFTNDPTVIARHEQFVSINGAMVVDLTGQIGVYAVGPSVYSGLGGQLAFHLGAFLSKRGRAITILPSAVKNGAVSTIVPQFEAGQIVSIPRELADTIVTDQGIAPLLGLSQRERAAALVEIAHPDHRDWLRAEAQRLYYP